MPEQDSSDISAEIIDGLIDQIENIETELGRLMLFERELQDGGELDLYQLHEITYALQSVLEINIDRTK